MTEVLAALVLGLLSAGHCLGMCGGLMMAAGLNLARPSYAVAYNLGRGATYVTLGAVLGFFGAALPSSTLPILKVFSALLLLMAAGYALGWQSLLKRFEAVGRPLWRKLQPLTRPWLPVDSHRKAVQLGLIWGLIPCGLVYTALAYALASADAAPSALIMAAFWLGTLPALLAAALAGSSLQNSLRHPQWRWLWAVLLFVASLAILLNLNHHPMM